MPMRLRNWGSDAAKLAVGDGALGFWSALAEVYPETQAQRCWVHKTVNILDKLPKSLQGDAEYPITWSRIAGSCSSSTIFRRFTGNI